jgi:hypothetical protein
VAADPADRRSCQPHTEGKLPALKNYEEFRKSYLKAAETLENPGKVV